MNAYKVLEEIKKRKNEIRNNQIPIEKLQGLVKENATEQEIQKLLKDDLSFLADVFASPADEYICLPEYMIGDRRVDFLILKYRYRMEVCLIEIKGANFNMIKSNHYKGMSAHIHTAKSQIDNHIQYINRNYDLFREKVHKTKEDVINGQYKGEFLLGPKGELYVDSEKDIKFRYAIIGGREKDEYRDSRARTIYENDRWEVYSWEAFIRRLDEKHGHYHEII